MKMKKYFSFMAVTTVVFTLLVAGCKFSKGVDAQSLRKDNENAAKWSNLTQNRPQIAEKFDRVGSNHNKMPCEVYNEPINFKDMQTRAVDGGVQTAAAPELQLAFEVSPVAQKFIERTSVPISLI
ncbi:hypothetical protein [Treponema pedis]|uniref:hypothetical protein n=1 Tax=Treponema pedis TaxID=409322 RepID=UPI0004108173|nr:hypothetical protein [Treponema pedis]